MQSKHSGECVRADIYDRSMIQSKIESIVTGWCNRDSRVRRRCPLTPLLFNIYVRVFDMKVAAFKQCIKYLVLNKDGSIEEKSQARFQYADGVSYGKQ